MITIGTLDRRFGALVLAAVVGLAISGVALAASVEPYEVNNVPGGAAAECASIGEYVYAYKIDSWGSDTAGDFEAAFDDGESNTIHISNNDGSSFDWTATNPIGAVFVKGGPVANVFEYDPQSGGDTDLYAPTNPNNPEPYDVSHVTFCWNPGDDLCFEHETGWGDGTRYVRRGNWATYTNLEHLGLNGGCVTLFAGQTMDAGEVCFAVGHHSVDISITLNEGWYFGHVDDAENPWLDNIHIQGYHDTPPSRNPAPGQFEWKYTAIGSEWDGAHVEKHQYYGVHVVLSHVIDCP